MRLLIGAILAVSGTTLSACSSGRSPARPAEAASAAATSSMTAATTALSSASLSVQVSRALVYQSEDGKSSLVVQRDPPPDCVCAGRTWQVRRFEVDAEAADARAMVEATPSMRPTREQTFLIVPGNSVAMVSEVNREEGVEVVFDPPLVVLPDGLPGVNVNTAEYSQSLNMTVHPLGDRRTVKRAGPVKSTVRYIGDERITTPAGTFTARRVESTFEADLSPAKVSNTSVMHMVDGVGLVREAEKETTTALGVPIRKNTDQWVLFSFSPAPTPAGAPGR